MSVDSAPRVPPLKGTALDYPTLRDANIARHAEWTNGQVVDFVWRGAELAGEVGEFSEILWRGTDLGYAEYRREVSDEFADGWICIDLTRMTAQLEPLSFTLPASDLRGGTSGPEVAAQLGVTVGRVCNTLKKLERENRGWPGSRTDVQTLATQTSDLAALMLGVMALLALPAEEAVRRKFNATSEKVGLQTRLAA